METSSKRHHYIPEFYLNGFTENGHFKIYLTKEKRFKKNGKEYPPRSHFFKYDDNTLVDGIKRDDFIERFYADIETPVAKIFAKIHKDLRLDAADIPYLQYFVSSLYWRLPSNRQLIDFIVKGKKLQELGLLMKDKETHLPVNDEEFEERIKNDPNFNKYMRAILPMTTYKDLFDCKTDLNFLTMPKGFPAICSDNPLILRNPNYFDIYRDDFILPISPTKFLIRIRKYKPPIPNYIRIDIDALIMAQANEFVCCTDINYPIVLDDFFKKNYTSIENLRNKIFNQFDANYDKS
jgi:hypothetical protein